MVNRFRCASIILTILGIGFLAGSVVLFILGKSFIQKAVKNECQLKPGAFLYSLWHDSSVPVYISIYVFDLNDTEFLNGTVKPSLRQRGPFVYKEERKKTDIRAYPDETISYREQRNYIFDPTRSAESETVNITTINIVYMTLINWLQMENISPTVRKIVGGLLSAREKPVMQHTVKEYLWGYEDPLLHVLKDEFRNWIPDDKISAFNIAVGESGLNTFLINNGVSIGTNRSERIKNVGRIEKFNFETSLPFWSNEYANMINGTDSTIWHPDIDTDERVYAFISDICRSIYFDFNETVDNTFDIRTYRYTLPNSVFANSTENEGFCLNSTKLNKTHELECLPNGLFSLKTCVHLRGNSSSAVPLPFVASNPHFLAADLLVQNAVHGLTPDELKHRSFIDIEPRTGIVMNVSRRFQININVINDSSMSAVSRVNPFVYPMIWIDEHAEIDQPTANTFHKKITTPITTLNVMKYVLLGIGITSFIIIIGLLAYERYKNNKEGPVFPERKPDETSGLLAGENW